MIRIAGIGGIAAITIYMLVKMFRKKKIDNAFIKPIIGLIISLLVLCIAPANDMFYYFASFISILVAAVSFTDIIKKHNILTTEKLPGLNKRGGDENA